MPDVSPVQYAGEPFNQVTNVAVLRDGSMYVADGYGNARVHRFDANGKLQFSWGEPGNAPGQFNLPHGIAVDSAGTVYVADRENSRIQLFSPEGEYRTSWDFVNRPDDIFIDEQDNVHVAELGFRSGVQAVPHFRLMTGATRQGWSRRKGVCDDFRKPCSSSSGCESRPAKGEPARAGSEPCAGTGNGSGDA